jgi:hypothetical protein
MNPIVLALTSLLIPPNSDINIFILAIETNHVWKPELTYLETSLIIRILMTIGAAKNHSRVRNLPAFH